MSILYSLLLSILHVEYKEKMKTIIIQRKKIHKFAAVLIEILGRLLPRIIVGSLPMSLMVIRRTYEHIKLQFIQLTRLAPTYVKRISHANSIKVLFQKLKCGC